MGIALITAVGLTWSSLRAQLELTTNFTANESVAAIAVRIDVAADGEELREPVALDLGSGFPLWLHPVGRVDGETLSFGAARKPRRSTMPWRPAPVAVLDADHKSTPSSERASGRRKTSLAGFCNSPPGLVSIGPRFRRIKATLESPLVKCSVLAASLGDFQGKAALKRRHT